jgi:hypothetical protein
MSGRIKIDVAGLGTGSVELPAAVGASSWFGPPSLVDGQFRDRIRAVLDAPSGLLPPLAQMVVPGDRVAIALDPSTPRWSDVVGEVVERLQAGGVDAGSTRVVALREVEDRSGRLPRGVEWTVHAPESREGLAYLASTQGGRRIYLNRHVTDADLVVAIGRLERSPLRMFGGGWTREAVVGPWTVVYPGLSDAATRQEAEALVEQTSPKGRTGSRAGCDQESREVGRLLGTVYQIGVIPGADGGVHDVHVGSIQDSATVRRAVREAWRFETSRTFDVVVARIGGGTPSVGWTELVSGVLSAVRLVRPGGMLLVSCPMQDLPGPAIAALASSEETRPRGALSGLSQAADYALARSLSDLPSGWHVALASGIDRETVEGLGFIVLEEGKATAQRLIDAAESCVFVDRPEITGVRIAEEA